MEVKLYKSKGKYLNAAGEEKNYTNFYISCNGELIPVEVKFFDRKDEKGRPTGKDPAYSARRNVLSAFADPLPEKEGAPKD